MSKRKYSLLGLVDLLKNESQRGVINGTALLELITKNLLPKQICDVRGKLRLIVERADDDEFEVTKIPTDTSSES